MKKKREELIKAQNEQISALGNRKEVVGTATAVAAVLVRAAAATTRSTATTLVGVAVAAEVVVVATTSGCNISRGLESPCPCPVEHLNALVEVGDHAEEIIHREGSSAYVQRRDQRLVVHVEPCNDVRKKICFCYGVPGGS